MSDTLMCLFSWIWKRICHSLPVTAFNPPLPSNSPSTLHMLNLHFKGSSTDCRLGGRQDLLPTMEIDWDVSSLPPHHIPHQPASARRITSWDNQFHPWAANGPLWSLQPRRGDQALLAVLPTFPESPRHSSTSWPQSVLMGPCHPSPFRWKGTPLTWVATASALLSLLLLLPAPLSTFQPAFKI